MLIAANASILPDIIAPHGTVAVCGTSASDVTYPSYGLLLIVFPSGSSSFMNFTHRPAGSNFRSDQSLQTSVVTAAIGALSLTAIVNAHHALRMARPLATLLSIFSSNS